MAKQQATNAKPTSVKAKFQCTRVADDPERAFFKTIDGPDASGNNDNQVLGGAELMISKDDTAGFFAAGGEYMFEITPVGK
ncbi:hypothetical protein DYU11_18300 [Fibrisoma montanum]|uniref:Uncharacterized protein n=1 Tax=Fibrisoma montanum TaxID=2305895 RepID=A0A418M5Y7_9BACT|nr:hypothetical protein [Fibrisoma montanum]RIV21358.1 hypothetical protein DYU11_18300 [Fibrisoma montanum]